MKSSTLWLTRYIAVSESVFVGVSTMFSTGKKQYGIWVFLQVQEINFLGPLKVNMNIVYFYMNFFSFYEKFFPLLTMHAFFRNILPHYNTHDIFYWFLSVDIQNYANKINCSFTKRACKFVIKT